MTDFLFSRELIAALAVTIGVYSYIPYLRGIYAGRTKPHVFSWFLWGLLTLIAFVAQYAAGGGPGVWVMGMTAFACLFIAVAALRVGEKDITRSDWIMFIVALAAIPLWYFTKNPLGSVILITAIDVMAFYPTFRKSWHKPDEEVLQHYIIATIKFALSMVALQNLNMVTLLYPAATVITNILFITMVLARRNVLKNRGVKPRYA